MFFLLQETTSRSFFIFLVLFNKTLGEKLGQSRLTMLGELSVIFLSGESEQYISQG